MNITTLRPVTFVTQLASSTFQAVTAYLPANSIFTSTFQFIGSVVQKVRESINTFTSRFSSLNSLFSRNAAPTPVEECMELELSDLEVIEDPLATASTNPATTEAQPAKNRKSELSFVVEQLIEGLTLKNDKVEAQLTEVLTQRLQQRGTQWREELPAIRSLLNETLQFLKIGNTFDYTNDDLVMELLPLAAQEPIANLYREMTALFPREKANIFSRILRGDLIEVSQTARRILKEHGDTRESSYREILKQCFRAGSNWKRHLQKMTIQYAKAQEQARLDAEDNEVTGKLTLRETHSELNEIRTQADTIANLMLYPATHKIKYKQHLIHILSTKPNWSSYADELLRSLQLVQKMNIKPTHDLMKAIEARVNQEPFLETFHYLSTTPKLPPAVQRYFFVSIVRGKLSLAMAVQYAQGLRNGTYQIRQNLDQTFSITYVQGKPKSKPKKRPTSGTHFSAASSHSGSHSGQQQKPPQRPMISPEAEDSSALAS